MFVATARSYWVCLWISRVLKPWSFETTFILSNYLRLSKFHQLLWAYIWSFVRNPICHSWDILGNGSSKIKQEEHSGIRLFRMEFDFIPNGSGQFITIFSSHEILLWDFSSSLPSLLTFHCLRLFSPEQTKFSQLDDHSEPINWHRFGIPQYTSDFQVRVEKHLQTNGYVWILDRWTRCFGCQGAGEE